MHELVRGGWLFGWILLGPMTDLATAQAPRVVPPQAKTQAPGYYRMMLGDFEVTVVSDGTVPLPADKLLTDIPVEEVRALVGRSRATLPLEASINTFLIHTGDHLILVDAGAGRAFGPKFGGRLIANLRAAGYQPEQVDAVLLTHIHGDHSMGLTVDGARVFPNADVYVNRVERDFRLSPDEAAKASPGDKHYFEEAHQALDLYIKASRIKVFDGAVELFPGIATRPAPGHTPGHTFFVVESRGQKLVLIGDTVHAAEVQFPRPSTTIQYDVDPSGAARRRLATFQEAADQRFWVGANHISFPGLGHIRAEGPGFTWIPAPYHLGP